MSTVVGDLSLTARENQIGSLFFDVQSDENAFLKVVKVPESKSVSLNDLDEIVSRFQLGVGVGQFQGIENLVPVLQESPKDGLKNRVNIRNNLLHQVKEIISLLFLKVKEQELVKLIVLSKLVRIAEQLMENLLIG